MKREVSLFKKNVLFFKRVYTLILPYLLANVYFGKSSARKAAGSSQISIIFLPYMQNVFNCGLTGIVSIKKKTEISSHIDLDSFVDLINNITIKGYEYCNKKKLAFSENYLGDYENRQKLIQTIYGLKQDAQFYKIFSNQKIQYELKKIADILTIFINSETKLISDCIGYLKPCEVNTIFSRIEMLKDTAWCLASEIINNVHKIEQMINNTNKVSSFPFFLIFKKINAVFNSIDHLEVRGRDSAGISLMFVLEENEYESFEQTLRNYEKGNSIYKQFEQRTKENILLNMGISVSKFENKEEKKYVSITITYKIAAEIGGLGDNINYLRNQVKNDLILHILVSHNNKYHTVSAHTRWASVGAITEANCHPADNKTANQNVSNDTECFTIHACLNGDIDNYLELKKEYEESGNLIDRDITSDTKIIPLQIEKYVKKGMDIEESFRTAVNDFDGSHAISMHTDLAPGKLFLAQKGSGQAIFIGLSENHYISTSEVYGFVEDTPFYLKMDGEKVCDGNNGKTRGQIFILNQESNGGLDGIKAFYYDKTPVKLKQSDIKSTKITTRDINRQGFPHYFIKEISESPFSMEKTLLNKWKAKGDKNKRYVLSLDSIAFPESIKQLFCKNQIKRIFFMGQGTAGVAAQVCAEILNYYMADTSFYIDALKASELSGFKLKESDDSCKMADTLIVAISQSGTTTDTNKTVDMVRERGAHTIAIVNRRDSDITFKVDGVIYTSSGRDIEMSVASTKAFYSQIIAGAILSLHIAHLSGRINDNFVNNEIKQMLELPCHMKKILQMQCRIEKSAKRFAATKTYWAAVGSGPNKASADEIRIKLSELCYKTISSDYVEDKKHIDLSSEPLIIVCAAGTTGTVLGDIIKDTAIFHAHKATTIVITDEGEHRFDNHANDVFYVPVVSQHFAPILNTLVGHIWGYYAALAINEGAVFLNKFRDDIKGTINEYTKKGFDIYEIVLEKLFREKIARFYNEFRASKTEKQFPFSIAYASDLTLILKYLSGKLPVSDFEFDFAIKGTANNMINALFEYIGESINSMLRPIDAIKHQAKTVTVGTTRESEKPEGILFEILNEYNFNMDQISIGNILVLKNLQEIVAEINGTVLYKITNMNLLGEPTNETEIFVEHKTGTLKTIPSRVEKDNKLKGTKRIIVNQGNVYIGKGRKDDRSIIVIPIMSASSKMQNVLEYLFLLNISFKINVALSSKIKALGGKYEHIKSIVQETIPSWKDTYIEIVNIEELFGRSAEKTGEFIIKSIDTNSNT